MANGYFCFSFCKLRWSQEGSDHQQCLGCGDHTSWGRDRATEGVAPEGGEGVSADHGNSPPTGTQGSCVTSRCPGRTAALTPEGPGPSAHGWNILVGPSPSPTSTSEASAAWPESHGRHAGLALWQQDRGSPWGAGPWALVWLTRCPQAEDVTAQGSPLRPPHPPGPHRAFVPPLRVMGAGCSQ